MSKHASLHHNENYALGAILFLIAYLALSLSSALIKSAMSFSSASWILLMQFFVGFLCVLPLPIFKGKKFFRFNSYPILLLRAILGVTCFYFFYLAVDKIPLVNATLFYSTSPFYIPFLLFLFIRKPISKKILIPISIGFVGIVFILQPTVGAINIGFFYGIVSGFFSGITSVLLRLLTKTNPLTVIFYYFIIASIILLPTGIFYYHSLTDIEWLTILGLGALFAISQFFISKSMKFACAADLAPLTYSFVIFSGIIDWIFWDHIPNLWGFIGILLVLIGGIFTMRLSANTPPNPAG